MNNKPNVHELYFSHDDLKIHFEQRGYLQSYQEIGFYQNIKGIVTSARAFEAQFSRIQRPTFQRLGATSNDDMCRIIENTNRLDKHITYFEAYIRSLRQECRNYPKAIKELDSRREYDTDYYKIEQKLDDEKRKEKRNFNLERDIRKEVLLENNIRSQRKKCLCIEKSEFAKDQTQEETEQRIREQKAQLSFIQERKGQGIPLTQVRVIQNPVNIKEDNTPTSNYCTQDEESEYAIGTDSESIEKDRLRREKCIVQTKPGKTNGRKTLGELINKIKTKRIRHPTKPKEEEEAEQTGTFYEYPELEYQTVEQTRETPQLYNNLETGNCETYDNEGSETESENSNAYEDIPEEEYNNENEN
jgi:hypothetical protein